MPSTPSSVLLFDVMSTLVYDPIRREIPEFFGLSLDALYEQKHPTAWTEFERAAISEQTFCEIYFPDRPDPIDAEALHALLRTSYEWIDGMELLLQELSDRQFEIHAFSNYPVWYEIIEDKLELSRYLDWSFVSCLTGLRKPDKRAYRQVLSTLDIAACDCLFIDDRALNCDAATKVGMDAIAFRDAAHLREALGERGVYFD